LPYQLYIIINPYIAGYWSS